MTNRGRSPGSRPVTGAMLAALVLLVACGKGESPQAGTPPARGSRGGPPGAGRGSSGPVAAVPVEVATAQRRDISSYIETNGTLEAENEVDVVARTSGPIVELEAEEGMRVERGRLLARLEQDEIRAQLEISRVNLEETRLAYERARTLQQDELISAEEYEAARAAFESAQAQFEGDRIQFGYTEIRAPFTGVIVARYVDRAEHVGTNQPLFRLSDFTPLLCPIQVPERELPRLRPGQRAYLTVESFPELRFSAEVLRLSPVIDAASGTVKVTLDVDAMGKLRPGMFARVFLETDVRRDTVVVPKAALSLESIGDTVYVVEEGAAVRREVMLGFREGDDVEIVAGVSEGERVVVVGQDGLSQGTPVRVLRRDGQSVGDRTPAVAAGQGQDPGPGAGPGRPRRGEPPDFSKLTPEQLERLKQRMRDRGLTEEQIEERIRMARERAGRRGDDARAPGDGDSAPAPR